MIEPWPVDTRVYKVRSKVGDSHADGAFATIWDHIGPIRTDVITPDGEVITKGTFGYFVIWDDFPGVPVFVAGHRLRPIEHRH